MSIADSSIQRQGEIQSVSVLESNAQSSLEMVRKKEKAFKITLGKGTKLTDSVKKELNDEIGCQYDGIHHKAYVCPIEKKEKVVALFEENKIDAKLIEVEDFNKNKSKKIKGLENSIGFFEEKISKEEKNLIIAVEKYDNKRNTYDFEKPPIIKNFSEDESDEKKNLRFALEMDFHKRYVKLKEDKKELENLRNSRRLLEEDQNNGKLLQNSLPIVKVIPGQLHDSTNYAEQILTSNNLGIFQRGGQLVRIITEISKPKKNKLLNKDGKEIIKRSADTLLITEVDSIYLAEFLGKHANWMKFDERKSDWVLRDCPERIAQTLIARREWNVPVLTGIIQAPTLRPDGSILDKPGYDEITGLFFNAGNIVFPHIPSNPSKDDATIALHTLLEILQGFPFENEESKSVAISGILTGLIRKSIRTAPLHGYTATKMGSGKSLLADVVGLIATGKNNSVITQAENEAEEKKRLLSVLSEGDSIICYDNIEHPFGSPALCSVLTQEEYKDRLLGKNRSLTVLTNVTFLVTGNNLAFIGDTSTRAILCQLDAQCERPEERSFDIDLRQYIPNHRGELVKAALTILRAYHVAGRPKQNIPQFGRFEDWSDLIRSSLVWLDMADPCVSRKEIENADPVRIALGVFLSAWYDYIGELSLTLKKVISKAEDEKSDLLKEKAETLLDALKDISSGNNEINTRSLGKKLASYKGRIENGYRLDKSGTYQGVDMWRVTRKVT